ncbi:hypothetical protein VFC49_06895 [Thermococcus sp. SY098]|uniref:hypothetical protein n=1 Tax=Thermococcus sp. SY098 TaxID=3111325 RepID=UPI002D76A2C3|nr:hypothetical protein [Thermococcus sp. SY098]WRS51812.1 hypothetical protein VFC49_06895 [Thermococcus sp. SY098]
MTRMVSDVLYFQVAIVPIVNELGVSDEDKEAIYRALGFKDAIDFLKKAKRYEKWGESAWYAEGKDGLILIEGHLIETWVRDYGDWKEYERALTFFSVVITKELFEEAERNPILAIRLAKEKLKERESHG